MFLQGGDLDKIYEPNLNTRPLTLELRNRKSAAVEGLSESGQRRRLMMHTLRNDDRVFFFGKEPTQYRAY